MADALVSGASDRKVVEVQLLSAAPLDSSPIRQRALRYATRGCEPRGGLRCTSTGMRVIGVAAIAILVVGCSPTQPSSIHTSPTPHGVVVSAGCGSTPIFKGGAPDWAHELEGSQTYQDIVPYVLASPPTAVGFLYGYPLRAGHPQNPTNKILWLVELPPRAGSLDITAHPHGAIAPEFSSSAAFLDSGDIPSIVDAPQPGCWTLDIGWSGHHAKVDLSYE